MIQELIKPKFTMELRPNPAFARLASDEQIQRTAAALEANGFHTIVVENGAEARQVLDGLIPEGAEVFDAASQTLEAIGFTQELHAGDIPYNAIKPQIRKMDRNTQMQEIRKMGSAPEYVVGSAHAITEDGEILVASGSGSQIAPYAYGAGHVILAVGAQKIVPDLETGLHRLREYSLPLEDARIRPQNGIGSKLQKILILNSERPGRIAVILIKEKLGF